MRVRAIKTGFIRVQRGSKKRSLQVYAGKEFDLEPEKDKDGNPVLPSWVEAVAVKPVVPPKAPAEKGEKAAVEKAEKPPVAPPKA